MTVSPTRIRVTVAAMEIPASGIMTAEQVAEYTGISASTLEKWRSANKGPAWHRYERLVRYHKREVDEWLASR